MLHLGIFSSDLFREHPVGKSFNAVLYHLTRHVTSVRVTVFGVLPEQRHSHVVGNETYEFPSCASGKMCDTWSRYVDLFGKHCNEQAVIINRSPPSPLHQSASNEALVRSRRVDILVELNGQTQNMRLDTLSHRPARLQVDARVE